MRIQSQTDHLSQGYGNASRSPSAMEETRYKVVAAGHHQYVYIASPISSVTHRKLKIKLLMIFVAILKYSGLP